MSFTDYHAKYIAHELTRRFPSDSPERLAGAVASAQVDLNPHQVDAALFAFASPLSKGALLADEVGLGKTIEAGLVLSQRWAERRRILVITPSNLRKQWFQELTEKFFLPCRLLEAKSYNAAIRQGQFRPFEVPEVVICSYQFAKSRAADLQATAWDLVVIDEAHRLRNVYKPSNIIANTLKLALAGRHKLLLTATPLQNSLLELFGLVSFIDERSFGYLKSFREQFARLTHAQVFATLKARLKPNCHRTLRRQVTAFIPFTKRLPLVEEFTPEKGEDRLYHLVSDYLQRDNRQALPARAKGRDLPPAEIRFDYGRHPGKISLIEPLIGRSGWLMLSLFCVESLGQGEDHLIFAAVTDDGEPLDPEVAARLMTVPGSSSPMSRRGAWVEGGSAGCPDDSATSPHRTPGVRAQRLLLRGRGATARRLG